MTLWDINVSFNHEPLYYSMSKGDDGVVTRECLVIKPSRRRSSALTLDSPAGEFAEKILMDNLYRAYQTNTLYIIHRYYQDK